MNSIWYTPRPPSPAATTLFHAFRPAVVFAATTLSLQPLYHLHRRRRPRRHPRRRCHPHRPHPHRHRHRRHTVTPAASFILPYAAIAAIGYIRRGIYRRRRRAPRNRQPALPAPESERQADRQAGRRGQSAVQTEYRWTENSSRRADCLRVHGRPAYPRRDKRETWTSPPMRGCWVPRRAASITTAPSSDRNQTDTM